MALITNVNLFLILSIKCHKYIGASILINLLRIKNCDLLSLQIFKDFIIKLHYVNLSSFLVIFFSLKKRAF